MKNCLGYIFYVGKKTVSGIEIESSPKSGC